MTKQLSYVLILAAGLAVSAQLWSVPSLAQSAGDDIESILSDEESAQPAAPAETAPAQVSTPMKDVSDLGKLETFTDVAVIQKRYLPKTGRFEAFAGLSAIMNDAFFNSFGVNGRLGYYFRERYGAELVAMFLANTEREVTTELRESRRVNTTSFITPKYYVGADFKWAPIYGKVSWRNSRITPFDLYFSAGLGLTGTNQETSEPTIHLGSGQIFALNKGTALRWDFSWNMFTATSSVDPEAQASLYHNLFLTFGVSWFFPEATYR